MGSTDSGDTKDHPHWVKDPPWSFNGPGHGPTIHQTWPFIYWLYFCILCNKNGIKGLRGLKGRPSVGLVSWMKDWLVGCVSYRIQGFQTASLWHNVLSRIPCRPQYPGLRWFSQLKSVYNCTIGHNPYYFHIINQQKLQFSTQQFHCWLHSSLVRDIIIHIFRQEKLSS